MNKINQFNKSGIKLGLLVTVVIACCLAGAKILTIQSVRNSVRPILQSVRNSIYSIQNFTSRADSQAMQDIPVITPMDVVWEMLGHVNKDRALIALHKLTGEEEICIDSDCYTIVNRLTGSEGLKWAQDYVSEELNDLGYSVEVRDWSLNGNADQNIIARKVGVISPAEAIYFIAHLDGEGTGVQKYPAADDDGSGVVDLLEMARVLSSYSFERTVVLLFTTGEEQGTLGSQYYLNELTPGELSSIKYAVDIDMVGYDKNEDGAMELWDGGDPSSTPLTHMMSGIIETYQIDLSPQFVTGCT
jgi:Peptidase family M28